MAPRCVMTCNVCTCTQGSVISSAALFCIQDVHSKGTCVAEAYVLKIAHDGNQQRRRVTVVHDLSNAAITERQPAN
eukprot:scaffold140545_cov22-Tisochrysis_lutea.AAC.2